METAWRGLAMEVARRGLVGNTDRDETGQFWLQEMADNNGYSTAQSKKKEVGSFRVAAIYI